MRICIVYDCLFPCTIGGAERWYRNLAERLAAQGHNVAYLTLTQWDDATPPEISDVRVISVGPRLALYHGDRRTVWPPIRFGLGVLLHLLRHGRDYDVVHTASFPFFSVLAIAAARPLGGFKVVCDWFEVWSLKYWRGYLGPIGGEIGWRIQALCAKTPQQAYAFSHRHGERLRGLGLKGPIILLSGAYDGPLDKPAATAPADPPLVVYAGRMIPEKRVPLLVEAIAAARRTVPNLHAVIFGRGPELERVRGGISALELDDVVSLPGFVEADALAAAMARALCVVQPSSREGYGLVVVEAAALGAPAVVIEGEDNAAVELIVPGVNGFVAKAADAESLAEEIVSCWRAGEALRASTRAWYAANAERLSLQASLATVTKGYAGAEGR